MPAPGWLLLQRQRRCSPPPRPRQPPAGAGWIHEIKHDGFRVIAWRDGRGTRLYTRNGTNFSDRFPFIVMAVSARSVRSCVIDGEAIVTDDDGLAVFYLIRGHGPRAAAVLCAFDLLELDGADLRGNPLEVRKAALKQFLNGAHSGIAFNEHFQSFGDAGMQCASRLNRAFCASSKGDISHKPGAR